MITSAQAAVRAVELVDLNSCSLRSTEQDRIKHADGLLYRPGPTALKNPRSLFPYGCTDLQKAYEPDEESPEGPVREVVSDCFTPWMDQVFVIGVVAMMVFLAAGMLLGVMLIKNRFRPRATAVIMVLQSPLLLLITSITSLGNSFIPLLWAMMIAADHMLRRAE